MKDNYAVDQYESASSGTLVAWQENGGWRKPDRIEATYRPTDGVIIAFELRWTGAKPPGAPRSNLLELDSEEPREDAWYTIDSVCIAVWIRPPYGGISLSQPRGRRVGGACRREVSAA